jgi:hypothetical protein
LSSVRCFTHQTGTNALRGLDSAISMRTKSPSLQVLRVCKQFHQEAEPIYLAKNLFVLPASPALRSPLQKEANFEIRNPERTTIRNDEQHLFSAMGLEKLKNFSVAFCYRSRIPHAMANSDWDREGTFDDMGPEERITDAHISASVRLRSI